MNDTVEGLTRAGKSQRRIKGVGNLGSGRDIRIRDLAEEIAALTGRESVLQIGVLPYRPTEIWQMSAAN
jgi:nucleoside-diphosphate-sugar epimerase